MYIKYMKSSELPITFQFHGKSKVQVYSTRAKVGKGKNFKDSGD